MRGGEKVLELLANGFSNAPIVTLLHQPSAVSDAINRHRILTSPLQRIPRIETYYRCFLPVLPAVMDHMPPVHSDILISTSHCVAKSLRSGAGTRHLCYCFTPMRYAWTFYDEYFGRNPLKALLAKPLLAHLRRWDAATASRVDRFVAISRHVQDRIRRFYDREADIVYPPVDTDRCRPAACDGDGGFDLIVSALVPYKRIDLAVEAYNRSGRDLHIVGTGGDYRRLQSAAKANIRFLGWRTDEEILELYRQCRLLVFPGEEDFGIVPLEAQACGKPVVAFARGGALETVRPDETGIFFDRQTPAALQDAVARCADRRWDRNAIRLHAESFGPQRFIDGLAAALAGIA